MNSAIQNKINEVVTTESMRRRITDLEDEVFKLVANNNIKLGVNNIIVGITADNGKVPALFYAKNHLEDRLEVNKDAPDSTTYKVRDSDILVKIEFTSLECIRRTIELLMDLELYMSCNSKLNLYELGRS